VLLNTVYFAFALNQPKPFQKPQNSVRKPNERYRFTH
jgi:hypothetical protein